jgi:hypothetical protein
MTTPRSGPERVREAIKRDRGGYAPQGHLTLCGTDDGTAVRADHIPPVPPGPRSRTGRLADRLIAPLARLMGF